MYTNDEQLKEYIPQINLANLKYAVKSPESFIKTVRKLLTQKYSHVKVHVFLAGTAMKMLYVNSIAVECPFFKHFFYHFGVIYRR